MRLVIATRNNHKAEEIRAILGPRFDCRTLRDFPDAPEAVEDQSTFEGNAAKKAAVLAHWLAAQGEQDALVLADDSGLEVDALNGAPGVHSARFAALDDPAFPTGKNSSDQANNAKLLRLLEDRPAKERTGRFRCVLALLRCAPDAAVDALMKAARTSQGACEGRIDFAPRGAAGFGYDPLFVPNGHDLSFAELGEDIKNRLSHRAKALERLREYLLNL